MHDHLLSYWSVLHACGMPALLVTCWIAGTGSTYHCWPCLSHAHNLRFKRSKYRTPAVTVIYQRCAATDVVTSWGTRRNSGGPAVLQGGPRRSGSLFVPNEKGEMVPAQSYIADLQGGQPPPGWS